MNTSPTLLAGALAAALLLADAVNAQPATRLPVSDLKPLLMQAIDQGSSRGVS